MKLDLSKLKPEDEVTFIFEGKEVILTFDRVGRWSQIKYYFYIPSEPPMIGASHYLRQKKEFTTLATEETSAFFMDDLQEIITKDQFFLFKVL